MTIVEKASKIVDQQAKENSNANCDLVKIMNLSDLQRYLTDFLLEYRTRVLRISRRVHYRLIKSSEDEKLNQNTQNHHSSYVDYSGSPWRKFRLEDIPPSQWLYFYVNLKCWEISLNNMLRSINPTLLENHKDHELSKICVDSNTTESIGRSEQPPKKFRLKGNTRHE